MFLLLDSSDHSEMLKKHYHDLLSRDLRRWKYADTKGDGALSRNEFEMFRHPTEHKQMMPVVAMVTTLFIKLDLCVIFSTWQDAQTQITLGSY